MRQGRCTAGFVALPGFIKNGHKNVLSINVLSVSLAMGYLLIAAFTQKKRNIRNP